MAKNKKAQDGLTQLGRAVSESTSLPRSLDPRYKAAVKQDVQRTKKGAIKSSNKPIETKDNRHWQSDSRAKERINDPNIDFSLGVLADTFIDQVPYAPYINASEAFNSGNPLMGISELLKQPYGATGDALINVFQENPNNIDVKTLESKVFGNSDISKKQKTKLSKAEQFIANDPYFFAEKGDPNFIKSLDRPFTHLRNLGARVAFDRDPKALLNLLAIGAMPKKNGGAIESYMGGLTDKGFNYNGAWGGPSMESGGSFPFKGKFRKFKDTLPSNLRNTSNKDYDMRYYWKHYGKPQNFETAQSMDEPMFSLEDDGYYHAPSVEPTTLRFLKPKHHSTLYKELEWYNSNEPNAIDFRNRYNLDTKGRFYQYTKKQMAMGGNLQSSMKKAIQTDLTSQKEKSVSKTCPPGFVNIEGKCFDRTSKEYKKLYDYGIGYMDKDDTLVSSRINLPEIVIKPLSSQQFIDDYAEKRWQSYAFDQLGKKYGFPEVKSQIEYKKKYPYSPFAKGGAHYWDNTVYGDNINSYIEELAHHVNKEGQIKKWILNDLPAYIMGKNPYEIEGTVEHTAHSITSPKLKKEFEEYRDKYYNEVDRPKWMDNPKIRKRGMQRIWENYNPTEKKQMGGMLPGAVGNMYSRDGAPSNGKYAKKTKASAAEGMEILPDPNDPERKWKLGATILSAKEILNPLLRAKDPAAYDAWNKGRVQALREKGFPAMREYTEKNPISIYLTPQEVKTALSKQREGFYEDYLGAIRGLRDYEHEIGAPVRETLFGGKEGAGDLEKLNYGWRFATLPTNVSRQATTASGKPIPEESFMYSYDPVKDEYKRSPYYKNGGKMMSSYYQAGLDFQPKTISKKGSKIKKDNDGYWNPENWGKPVEIDSNEITMQGVYQPLLGISDTGDVQMMYPGEDYTFDGESVTEYPVAQNGVGIPKDIYLKQAYKESRFNPKAISPLGEDTGRGIAQISKSTYNDFLKATKYKPEQIDLMNPEHSAAVQRWAMNDLYNSEFINKPNQSNEVRLAKTLAAYNYGRGNLSDALVAAKEKGMDIYNSLDWLKVVPKETSDYVNKILLKKDDKFEKEYSEAVKKSPYTKYYESGGNINQLDEAPLKKLDDLLNFSNNNDMKKAKKGKNILKAQVGTLPLQGSQLTMQQGAPSSYNWSSAPSSFVKPSGVDNYPLYGMQTQGTPTKQSPIVPIEPVQQMTVPSSQTADTATAALLGGSKAAQWYSQIKNAVDERKRAKVFKNVSEVVKEAATSRPDMPKRKYVRPEDNLLSPNQSSFQSFGTGYDILSQARDGMQIGGNLTEIQNMYNPGTLYDNLGYEPLEDSQMKQYKKGGDVPKAMAGAIMAVLPQIMEKANQAMDAPVNLATSLISRGTKKWTEEGLQNMQQGAYNQALSNQFGAFMKDGGWVSHDWQPQVITKFGDYTMKQLLTPPNDAEMLRAGGNVRNMRANYMGDDERLSMMAMGGNLQTHWGGKGEVMSYNPYSPGSGETVMLRGQSHEETDGRGNSGIGMSYGGNMVEAERGEPVAEMQEGGAVGDTSAVVFGNMMIPSYGVSELGDNKAKGKKFKSYAADLSKQEAKQNKLVDKATKLIDDVDEDSPFDLLKLNAGMAMFTGADMRLKDLDNKKKTLAGIQNAILDTAEEMGLESDALARGKMKQAKKGAKIPKGQVGVLLPKDEFDFMSRGYNTPQIDFDSEAGLSMTPRSVDVTDQDLISLNNIQRDYSTPQIDFNREYLGYPKRTSTNSPAPTAPFTPFEIDLQKGVRNPYAWSSPASSFQKPSNVDNYPLYTMQTEGTPTDNEPVVKLDKKMLRKLTKDNKSDSSKIKDFINENKDYIGMGYNELLPYIRPTNKLPLDPFQFMGEQLALATNTLEPVQAQTFKPMLETRAPKMSAQEALNKNQADFNALARQIGNNPAALSILAAQKQAADRQAIAQVEATNIQQEMAANNRNIAMLNDASLKNLAILDTQYQRQAGAKANTKAQAQAALNSIASKIGQNKLENFQSGVMQNMYNYRFGPQGRIINYNPLAQFNTQQLAGSLTDEMKQALAEQSPDLAKQLGIKVKEKEKSRNGSIVKAIKNL